MNPRFVLAKPVEQGDGFWTISDTQRDFPWVTIWKDTPEAEALALEILERLNTRS